MLSNTQRFILLASSMLLSACFKVEPTAEQLCSENRELQCQKLNMRDSQCRHQRDALIFSRFDVLKDQHDLNKLNTIKATVDYQKCLTSAAQIEPILSKEVKTTRSEALLHSYDSVNALVLELQPSTQPEVLFYRWINGDRKALNQFLKLEGTQALESAELQYALASFYAKRDEGKTISILKHALALLTEQQYNDGLHTTLIESLASLNQEEGNKKNSYIWALVATEFDLPIVPEKQFELLYPFSPEEKLALQKYSDTITKNIKLQKFHTKLLPSEDKL